MPHALQTSLLVALIVTAVGTDLRYRRIPNALTLTGVAFGLGTRAFMGGEPFLSGLAGAAIALGLCIPLVLAGGLGGGDAKLLAAVGAFIGLEGLPVALAVTAIAGGVMAIAAAIREGALRKTLARTVDLAGAALGRSPKERVRTLATPGALAIPYGVAIGMGALAGWWM